MQQLLEIERKKMAYFERVQAEQNQRKLNVQAGEQLPERLIGPHSIASFTTEWRAYPFTIWHTFRPERPALLPVRCGLATGDVTGF